MREILFRGKRIDKDEWVYGDLVHIGNKSYITYYYESPLSTFINETIEYDGISIVGVAPFIEVDPSTVGQYTGLTDKNGKKIFEGDIVKCRIVDAMLIKTSDGNEKTEFIGPVKYINGSFYIVTNSNEELEVRAVFEEVFIWEAEVIGNIYDNPTVRGQAR